MLLKDSENGLKVRVDVIVCICKDPPNLLTIEHKDDMDT